MKKEDRYGIEVELTAMEQYVHMIKQQLRKKNTNMIEVLSYLNEIRNNLGFCQFTLSGRLE